MLQFKLSNSFLKSSVELALTTLFGRLFQAVTIPQVKENFLISIFICGLEIVTCFLCVFCIAKTVNSEILIFHNGYGSDYPGGFPLDIFYIVCFYQIHKMVCHATVGTPPQLVPWTICGKLCCCTWSPLDQVWLP